MWQSLATTITQRCLRSHVSHNLLLETHVCLLALPKPGPLAVWVVANLHYSRVLKQIAPLEGQLDKLKGDLSESQGRLQQCQEELMGLDQQVCLLLSLVVVVGKKYASRGSCTS